MYRLPRFFLTAITFLQNLETFFYQVVLIDDLSTGSCLWLKSAVNQRSILIEKYRNVWQQPWKKNNENQKNDNSFFFFYI